MQLLDGKATAATIREEVAAAVARLGDGDRPTLALVRVGDDPASSVYVKTKAKACAACGIESLGSILPEDASEEQVLEMLRAFNDDPAVNGILLQLPLPAQINQDRAIRAINPLKDVDGFHPENAGLLASANPRFVACTPLGIREIIVRHGIETSGREVVILGRSIIVGKPMALLFSMKGRGGDATVTICHSRTKDLASHTRRADIIVAAMGQAHFVTADMVRDGAVVIDVGINRIDDASAKKGYRLVGDVDFDAVAPRTSYITPVPGGIGPMTVAMLMANTLQAHRLQAATPDAVR